MTTLPNDHNVRNDMNCGALIGRADLSDDVVIEAVKNRLAAKARSSEDAESVVNAAMAGDAQAMSILRTIQVPAPTVRLAMPAQPLTRERQRRGFRSPSSAFPGTAVEAGD